MKDTIDKLVDIDNQSRAVINKCEEKEENLDNYVTIELEKRKAEINPWIRIVLIKYMNLYAGFIMNPAFLWLPLYLSYHYTTHTTII